MDHRPYGVLGRGIDYRDSDMKAISSRNGLLVEVDRKTNLNCGPGPLGKYVAPINPPVDNGLTATYDLTDPANLAVPVLLSPYSVADAQVQLPMGTVIDWGDGTTTTVGSDRQAQHAYTTAGTYEVKVSPPQETPASVNMGHPGLIEVTDWGEGQWTHIILSREDNPSELLTSVPDWLPPTVTSILSMFNRASSINDPNIANWDTSNVTNMRSAFYNTDGFNQPIGSWNTSKVTTTRMMFRGATLFNQSLNDWDMSNNTDITAMFQSSGYNSDLNDWDTSSVVNMGAVFQDNPVFDKPLGNWDVRNVEVITKMFQQSTSFNQDLSTWCVDKISTPPADFDQDATAWTEPRPQWGGCA